MSISHILTRNSDLYTTKVISPYASENFVSKGIELRSAAYYASVAFVPPAPPYDNPFTTPVVVGITNILSGDDADGRFLQVVYTKVDNVVTIKFEAFSSQETNADAATPHSNFHNTGAAAASFLLTFDALDARLRAQIINDISVINPRTKALVPLQVELTGIGTSSINPTIPIKLRITAAGNFEFLRLDNDPIGAAAIITLGGVSFVSSNSTIVV